jgi:lipopolysaccharide/colanic/teichoic acid biosynthesis glycosyltransferase
MPRSPAIGVERARVHDPSQPASGRRAIDQRLRRAGYQPVNPRTHRIWNASVALVLIAIAAPAMIVISLALVLTQGTSILYRGPRLGRGRVPFTIYKFRTLRNDTAQLMRTDGALQQSAEACVWRLHNAAPPDALVGRMQLETPVGGFLRKTRLDELPQLFNVLKGDMCLLGPRPVRAETAATFAARLHGYEERFSVSPGLVGYTQALMTHDTSQAIRQRFDLILCRRPAEARTEAMFLMRTALAVMTRTVALAGGRMHRALIGFWTDRRQSHRMRPRNGAVIIRKSGNLVGYGYLLDMNDEAFTFISPLPLPSGQFDFRLMCHVNLSRRRTARCRGIAREVYRRHPLGRSWRGDYCYLVAFVPTSAVSQYIIDRYFLRNCVVFHRG